MENITGPEDLQNRLDDHSGYLANRDVDARTYTVHDLAYFCNAKVKFTPPNPPKTKTEYPKYWAETTDEFTERLGLEGDVWDLCGNCRSKREAARRRRRV